MQVFSRCLIVKSAFKKGKENKQPPPTNKNPTNSLKIKYRIISNQVQYGSKEFLGKKLCGSLLDTHRGCLLKVLRSAPLVEQIKPSSEGTVPIARCDKHAPAALRLMLLLLVNTRKGTSRVREEGDEVTLPCLSLGLAIQVSRSWLQLRGCWLTEGTESSGFGHRRYFLPEGMALRH